MKMKKIISSALVAVLLFGAVIGVMPINAKAAYSESNSTVESLTATEIDALVNAIFRYNYGSAEEMLLAELEGKKDEAGNTVADYLVQVNFNNSPDSRYRLYVNKYTGFVYYQDRLSGQILTSNPYKYPTLGASTVIPNANADMASQIVISYSETSKNTVSYIYSSTEAALNSQISVEFITNGVRVNYTLGDTVARYLLPGYIRADKFENELLVPMLNDLRDLMIKYCNGGNYNEDFDIFEADAYNIKKGSEMSKQMNNVYYKGALNVFGVQKYLDNMTLVVEENFNASKGNLGSEAHRNLQGLLDDIWLLYGTGEAGYLLRNLGQYTEGGEYYEALKKKYYINEDSEIAKTLEPIYEFTGATNPVKASASKVFEKRYNQYREKAALESGEEFVKYSFTEMYEDESYCGYVDQTDPKPVFKCALEYSFNTDGSLSVRLPANSISFDETLYNLNSITVLKYFGAADAKKDGYIFFPDGSGMVLEYDDFYNPVIDKVQSTSLTAEVYGADNSYSPEVDPSKITGVYREQVSMPVFGVVGEEKASIISQSHGVSTVTNGYFAIIENGASLGKLEFQTGMNNTASAFCSYSPYPSDKYDLSNTISVGGADYYTIVSDAKFNGSYVTRYVMLTDEAIRESISEFTSYESSYSGMAAYYRDYLYGNGTLSAIAEIKENMPLYIEALGSMDIMDKFLTFPVEKSISLTTFDDVATMYNELRNSSDVLKAEMEKYQAMADAEADASKKAEYQALADQYKNYADFVINNINFRLTGFGSGGLSSNYPSKLRWEKACGGKRGFKQLLETANGINAGGDVFGIYPEYDFMYLSYSASFDGISVKKDVSKMIDNRYASKQVYDSISRQYVSYFSLVVSPESLDKLYTKFVEKYEKYDVSGISVSTLGSDLNSNFDEEKLVNRNDAQDYVETVLARMVKQNNYDVMLDTGNVYAVRYASHLLNVATDSSRVRYSSYSVPFVGMILHGAVNYAGKPLNYSGMPEYDLLRSIESGASLYFILCYENESYMKNDEILNDYFGVSYSSWYKDVVLDYYKLNSALSDLQDYIITDHQTVIGERVVDSAEQIANYKLLMDEIITMMDGQLDILVTRGYEELRKNGEPGWYLTVSIDKDALLLQFEDLLKLDFDGAEVTENAALSALIAEFEADIDALIARYYSEYPGAPENSSNPEYEVVFDQLIYGISDILLSEMLVTLDKAIGKFVESEEKYVEEYNTSLTEGKPLKLVISITRQAILDAMADVCKIDAGSLDSTANIEYDGKVDTFGAHIDDIIEKYESKHPDDWEETKDAITGELTSDKKYTATMNSFDTENLFVYTSKYSFITDSSAFDENYIYTDYTSDRGNIVIVTYTKGDKQVKFLLNYNIYTVEVKLGNETYKLEKYGYVRIEG